MCRPFRAGASFADTLSAASATEKTRATWRVRQTDADQKGSGTSRILPRGREQNAAQNNLKNMACIGPFHGMFFVAFEDNRKKSAMTHP
jgi:hypothetical protein